MEVRFSNGVKFHIAVCLEKPLSNMFMLPMSSSKFYDNTCWEMDVLMNMPSERLSRHSL